MLIIFRMLFSMVMTATAVISSGSPLCAQSQDSSTRAVSDTNPYAHLPHLEFTARIQPGNPAPDVPRSLIDSLTMPRE